MPDLRFLDFAADFDAAHIVRAYDELPLWSAMFGLLLLEEVPLPAEGVILDVGCGAGFPLIELAERCGAGVVVHGLDPWRAGLERARQKVADRGVENVVIHEGSASAIPLDDGSVDLIVSNLGLNNFDDRSAAIRECRRVAREGAPIALTTNLRGHMREFYDVLEDILRKLGDTDAIERLREHVAHRATIAGVVELLTRGGFRVSRIREQTASMRFASGAALLNHHFIKLGFLDGWKNVVPQNQELVFGALLDGLKGPVTLTIPMAYVEASTA